MSDNHTSEKALLGLKMAQQYLGEKLLTALRKDTVSLSPVICSVAPRYKNAKTRN